MQSLSKDERKEILGAARECMEHAVIHGQVFRPLPEKEIFQRKSGVFVTLHREGKLRGCIGVLGEHESLGENLIRAAVGAALSDPRFEKVKPEELEKMEIEVSLLSPVQTVNRVEEIEVGRDGLVVERGMQRGLLLPQVATEQHLDRERFLQETCHKAGLPREAWREPATKIYRFQCEVMREEVAKS